MQFKKFGKYSVIKKIASGGMADILLSISLSPTGFGRFVIIKKALAKFSDNQDFNDMFKNEAKVACNLKHKNITSIYEFGIEKEQLFLTMEYISGKNLREITKKIAAQSKELGIDNAVYIIKEVASGLNYAHNAIDSNTGLPLNIIHRDVSPQNIMLSFDGEIKLIDFGIAKISDANLTKAGHLKGKFSYMSPEQAQGDQLDERTDIFCLGIILWELLTGKRLFASENEMASLKKVRNCNIPSAQKINPKIPSELNDIVMKALSKNKNLRYKTASRFERDLNLYLNKNYPEYSHYNLTFLIKTVYRKEVMQERERLKMYSSEFKKYINALNLEKSLSSPEINFKTIGMGLPNNSSSSSSSSNIDDSLLKTKTSSLVHQNNQPSIAESFETQSELESIESSFMPTEEHSQRSTQSESTFQIERESSNLEKEIGEELSQSLLKKPDFEKLSQKTQSKKVSSDSKTQKQDSISKKFKFDQIKLLEDKKPPRAHTSYTINTNLDTNMTSSLLSSGLRTDSTFFSTLDREKPHIPQRKKRISPFLFKSFISIAFVVLIAGSYFFYFKDFLSTKKPVAISSQAPVAPKPTPSPKPVVSSKPAIVQKSSPVITRNPKSVQQKIFIRSKPSNAGIYINNKFISKYTPYIVTVHSDKSYLVTIKKPGYFSKNFQIKPGQTQNNIELQLIRKNRERRGSVLIVD